MSEKLPEPFAPKGPRPIRFPIQPAPPVRPHLLPDERLFAVRLAVLAGGCELAAWAAIGRALAERRDPPRPALLAAAAGVALLRTLRPAWARLGARLGRPLVAGLLFLAALALFGAWLGLPARSEAVPLWAALLALALPALGDLAASAAGDALDVERRPAAFSAIEMGQGLGAALGLGIGAASPLASFLLVPPFALLAGAVALRDLRDRGAPRSTWPIAAYLRAARPVALPAALAGATALLGAAAIALSAGTTLGGKALPLFSPAAWMLAPIAGMALLARLGLRATLAVAAAAFCTAELGPEGLGGMFGLLAIGGAAAALPAAVVRDAPEMERAPAASVAWMALAAGAGLGALVGLA